MIRKLKAKNADAYFANDNILMLIQSHDRHVYENVFRQFNRYLYLFARYITRDETMSREVVNGAFSELFIVIDDGVPVKEYVDDLYQLTWQKILQKLYTGENREYILSLKDNYIRGYMLAETIRQKRGYTTTSWMQQLKKAFRLKWVLQVRPEQYNGSSTYN